MQAANNPYSFGLPRDPESWRNVTGLVTLCCSGAWQWVPFGDGLGPGGGGGNGTVEVAGDLAILRVALFESFGNPHRVALSGLEVLAARAAPTPSPTPSPAAAVAP